MCSCILKAHLSFFIGKTLTAKRTWTKTPISLQNEKGNRFDSILFNVVCWYSETELLMFHYHVPCKYGDNSESFIPAVLRPFLLLGPPRQDHRCRRRQLFTFIAFFAITCYPGVRLCFLFSCNCIPSKDVLYLRFMSTCCWKLHTCFYCLPPLISSIVDVLRINPLL